MKVAAAWVFSLSLAGGVLAGANGKVTPILSKDLAGVPGRELTMVIVDCPPGASSPAHVHHTQALVYVLEGSIVMQAKGEAPVTLGPARPGTKGRPTCTS